MRRRVVLLVFWAAFLKGDAAREVGQLFDTIASALSSGNASEFLSAFDRSMPGYDALRTNVNALLQAGEAESSLAIVKQEGDDQSRTVQIDWLLILKRGDDATVSTRREQTVTCGLKRQGRRWKIVSLDPIAFFAPPAVR